MKLWHNGEIADEATSSVATTCAGVLLGEGVFTTTGVWSGQPFLIERHLSRLHQNAQTLQLALTWDEQQIEDGLRRVLCANDIQNGMARVTLVARGDGRWNSREGTELVILARPRPENWNPRAPLHLLLSPFRLDEKRPLAGIKSTSHAEYSRIWRAAHFSGYDEAIICTSENIISECARANLLWVKDRVLYTPALDTGCLPGIARGWVLERWAQNGGTVIEGRFLMDALMHADEIFITSAATGPRAVTGIAAREDERIEMLASRPVTIYLQEMWEQATLANRSGHDREDV